MVRLFLAFATTIITFHRHVLGPYHTALVIPGLFHGHTAGWLMEQHSTAQPQNSKPMHVLDATQKYNNTNSDNFLLYSCHHQHVTAILEQIMINVPGKVDHPCATTCLEQIMVTLMTTPYYTVFDQIMITAGLLADRCPAEACIWEAWPKCWARHQTYKPPILQGIERQGLGHPCQK